MMANYTLVTFLVVIMTINIGLGLVEDSMKSFNPDFDDKNFAFNFSDSPASYYTGSGSLDSGAVYNDTSAVFFESVDGVNPDGADGFTDNFKTTSQFLQILQTGGSLILSLLTQPAGFMIAVGIPIQYAIGFQVIWYLITIFLLLNFRKGGV